MIGKTFTVKHGVGLHARPAAKFVKLAKEFESGIRVRNLTRDGEEVDAKSLVKVIKIAAAQHHEIHVSAEGPDEEVAMKALSEFLTNVPEEEQ
jgi:phosphotransferase system HPr (HPr) family protein